MENRNYYDILGVSVKTSIEEITAAKNELAKRFHPDANLKDGVDTTKHMQAILEAYQILSDPARRAEYDRVLTGRTAQMQTFDLKADVNAAEDTFVTYWKAASELYQIILQAGEVQRAASSQLVLLSMQALKYIIILRDAEIPEKYWHPDTMNWLLFTWYKNRNITLAYLLSLYDEHLKKDVSPIEKLRLQSKAYKFTHSVKKLIKK